MGAYGRGKYGVRMTVLIKRCWTSATEPRRTRRGFALLVTIVLVAFLVLILVALASFTRVETQVAANGQAVAQARQNALMGLNIAIGQLQRYAGIDPVLTGTRELTSASAVTNAAFTGVWDAGAPSANPVMWLISGSEQAGATAAGVLAAAPDPSDDSEVVDQVFLVGNNTVASDPANPTLAERQRRVKLVKQNVIVAAGSVPGLADSETPRIGRYAWWVGDEGVKASLGIEDRADEVTYAPWDTPAQRSRIRQQIGSSPNYFRTGAASTLLASVRTEGFDPLDAANEGLVKNTLSRAQLGLLVSAGGVVPQRNFARERWHDFTPVAYGVLANTLPAGNAYRGLMEDLSLKPQALGSAFAAYADYASYMETPGSTTAGTAAAIPAISSVDSPRRRYRMVAPVSNAAPDLPEIAFSVAPVLTNFYIQFAISKPTLTSTTLNVQSRLYVTLWNPYSTALAPEQTNGLSLEVELPSITAGDAIVDLNQSPASNASGGIALPFGAAARHNDSQNSNYGGAGELASWLPGRIYSWTTNPATIPTAGTALGFYSNLLSSSWTHPAQAVPSTFSRWPALELPAATITVRLKLNGTVISTYEARYDAQSEGVGTQAWRFGYAFRLNQPRGYSTDRSWLKTYDPRDTTFAQADVVASDSPVLIPFGTDSATASAPLIYSDTSAKITSTTGGNILVSPLLYRVQGLSNRAVSTYNDASLFELPRLPLLSTGELQHLRVVNKRPHAIGNSWGAEANVIFDRFFFSGVPATGVHPDIGSSADEPLPNWKLIPLDGVTLPMLRSDATPADAGLSSRFLLQAGAFNVNSTSVAAWRAVLSSVRFSEAAPFVAAAFDNTLTSASANAGTQNNTATQSHTFNADSSLGAAPAPVFFRFPQSAQEVFYWARPTGSSSNDRQFSASAFRLGVRGYNNTTVANGFVGEAGSFTTGGAKGPNRQHLTTDQIELLAEEIVKRVRARAAANGPFTSLQEFLSETDVPDGDSLLESAIRAAGMNALEVSPDASVTTPSYAGYSSLTLTQADLLNALAPYLRVRSDTFVVRTYGESVNPVTGITDAQVWGEATVQRFPEPAIPGDSIAQPAQAVGRRFKIISFRWLTPTDI